MGVARGAEGPPAVARGGRQARSPPARRGPRPVQLSGGDRLRAGGLPSQGRHHPARDGGLLPPAARAGGLCIREQSAHLQVDPVRDLRAPAVVRRRHVPAHADGGGGLLPQADELPVPHPDLPGAGTVLSGVAVAAVRVRNRLPLREVRGRARTDQGAGPDHGRRAHLLYQRAAGRRTRRAAGLRARPAPRLRPERLLPGAVHPRRFAEVHRRPGAVG